MARKHMHCFVWACQRLCDAIEDDSSRSSNRHLLSCVTITFPLLTPWLVSAINLTPRHIQPAGRFHSDRHDGAGATAVGCKLPVVC
jgi:hypothetical protein